jgi:predicted extracellular nuclease
MAISQELLKPAILCVQNIDNSNSLADIAATVNTLYGGKYKIAAARKYVADFWVDTPATFSPQGLINGFLYDSTVFHLSSAFLMSGPAIDSSFGRLSAIPTAQPLVGAFTIAGSTLAIVNVTLADKGRDDPLYVKTWPVAENSKAVRAKQARAVRTWMNATLTSVPGLYLLVVGEFNDYPFAEPLDGSECPVSIVAGHAAKGETVLYNAYDYLAPDTRYTCITAGRAQMTAQLMVSPSLAPLAKAVDALHFNAAFEEELGSDATTPVRCSRHDAVEIRF